MVVRIKRGIFSKNKNSAGFAIPSFTNNVVDAVGAGDALLAYATLSMLITKSLLISSILGSVAAACKCETNGNIAIKPEQLITKINLIQNLSGYKIQR